MDRVHNTGTYEYELYMLNEHNSFKNPFKGSPKVKCVECDDCGRVFDKMIDWGNVKLCQECEERRRLNLDGQEEAQA